ncbi:unnamed protein product [Pylaiella littoralis]
MPFVFRCFLCLEIFLFCNPLIRPIDGAHGRRCRLAVLSSPLCLDRNITAVLKIQKVKDLEQRENLLPPGPELVGGGKKKSDILLLQQVHIPDLSANRLKVNEEQNGK